MAGLPRELQEADPQTNAVDPEVVVVVQSLPA